MYRNKMFRQSEGILTISETVTVLTGTVIMNHYIYNIWMNYSCKLEMVYILNIHLMVIYVLEMNISFVINLSYFMQTFIKCIFILSFFS